MINLFEEIRIRTGLTKDIFNLALDVLCFEFNVKESLSLGMIGLEIGSIINRSEKPPYRLRAGIKFLELFEEKELIKLGKYNCKFPVYVIRAEYKMLCYARLEWAYLVDNLKMPSLTPYPDWTKSSNGKFRIVKTRNKEVLRYIDNLPPTSPLFVSLNKSQKIGWTVDKRIVDLQKWAFDNEEPVFNNIWKLEGESRVTRSREAKYIIRVAEKLIDKTFYHQYYYDFRGRKYCRTAYLNELGFDQSKGLLRFAKSSPIKDKRWLQIYMASEFGVSGSIEDKIKWAKEHEKDIRLWSIDPKKYKGWMEAEEPWKFISCCFEYFNKESNLVIYIDGSNNGSQHYAALTKDEELARWTNLDEVQEDYYYRCAEKISEYIDNIPETYTKKEIEEAAEISKDMAPDYWRGTLLSHLRKVVKRGVLSIPYSATKYGLGTQLIHDIKNFGIEELENTPKQFCVWMGSTIYEVCKNGNERVRTLMEILTSIAESATHYNLPIKWITPSGFPVIQDYTEAGRQSVKTSWLGKEIRIEIPDERFRVTKTNKIKQGICPNLIHSLDASHLMNVVVSCDFDVATVHDSFGCAVGDMDNLYKNVRLEFFKMYSKEVLESILNQLGYKEKFNYGKYNIAKILKSKYAFI